MGHVFAFGLLIFRSYDVFMMFDYKMNKFSKKQLIHQIFDEATTNRFALKFIFIKVIMSFKIDTSRVRKYFDVDQLYGNSYSYVGLNIDGPDEVINKKLKQMQAKEFEEVAKTRLFNQKIRYRFKIMAEREEEKKRIKRESEQNVVVREILTGDYAIEAEFRDFQVSDFFPQTLTEGELSDLIIDVKMDDIEEANTKKERCCAWVLNHCK